MRNIDQMLKERLLADGNMTIEDFHDTLKALLDAAWGEDWGMYIDDEPTGSTPESIRFPIIAYDTTNRVPTKEIATKKPRLFHYGVDPNNPGDSIYVYRQWFDYTIRFDVWAQTNKECSATASRLEDLLLTYAGYIKSCGVDEITFLSEGIDLAPDKWRLEGIVKSIRYLIRIQRITIIRKKTLKEVVEKVYVRQGAEVPAWVTQGNVPLPTAPASGNMMQTMNLPHPLKEE